MKLITSRIQISNQFFRSLIFSFNTSTRIQYWNHSSSSRILRDHICFTSKRSRFFRLDVELNTIASETTRTCWRKISLSILYWHYSSCSRILRNSICFTSTTISSLSLQRWIEYQIFRILFWRSLFRKRQESSSNIIHRHSESRSPFLLKSIQELHLFFYQSIFFSPASAMTSKQQKREARKRAEAAKSASSTYFDLFNSTVINDDSEWDIFSEFTGILQRLQQLQRLHRESDLLDLLQDCLMSFALNWFESQSKFISLHDFNIALTKAFSSSEFATNQTISLISSESSASQKQQKSEISTSDRCQWCQLDYYVWNSHRLQYSSCAARNQQAYEFALQFLEEHACEIFETSAVSTVIVSSVSSAQQKQQKSNALKIAKKTKTNVVKNAKRVKSKALKTQEVAKLTSELQNIDIFDSTLTYENRRFSEIANFLQHLQQCQHQYKESDLLFLLSSCLWDFAFDIWFDKQTIMKSASLSDWIEILRVDFANASFAKSKVNCSKITCMRCDRIFNFKKKLREHVREQHAKKSVNSSSLSIDTAKSVCETEKRSTVIETFALQASHISSTTSSSQIVFEITSSKSSSLSIETLKVVCERMKKSAIIASSAPSASQKSDISTATLKQKFESVMIFETVTSSKNSHLSSSASEIVSKSMKNKSIQCFTTSSKSSFSSTFESERQEASAQKFFTFDAFLSNDTVKSVCESEKNSAVTCSTASFTSFLSVFKRSCFICRIDVSSVQEHYHESSSCREALRHKLEQQLARHAHQREQKAQKQVELIEQESQKQAEVEKAISQSAIAFRTITLLKRSNLSSFTFETKLESTKRSATCRRCNQIFNFNNKLHEHIRQHHVRKSVISRDSDLRVFASESLCKIIEKSAVSCSFISQFASSTFFATSTQIFWRTRIFNSISSNRSNLSLATYKIASELTKSVSVTCSLTFTLSSSRTSVRKHHEFHMKKSYFIMNDLSRMFDEKSKSFDLQQHQNRALSSRSFDIRQSHSIKSHLTIENLFEMFNEKFRRKSLFQGQRNVSSREFFSEQSRITVYFKSAVNKKPSISQNSKNSKSKSLKQLIFAKSIRITFTNCSEKSIISSYKMSDIFSSSSMINCFRNEVFEISYAREIPPRQFRSSSSSSELPRCCRICSSQFSSNNDLHRDLKVIHLVNQWKWWISRFETKLRRDEE